MLKQVICAVAFVFACNVAWAGANDPIITKAWIGESVPGQTTATLQLNLTTMKPVNLLSASSPLADTIEIHSVTLNKGVMKTQHVKTLDLPGHRTILFGSRNLFLMLTGLKQPLKIGEQVPVNLTFQFPDKQSKIISATAEVRQMELSYKHYGPNEVYDHH